MKLSYVRALSVLHRTFASSPFTARLHILGRFLTCPFLRVLRYLPDDAASLLDLGAGHGTFARLAVEQQPRRVTCVEPDLRKALMGYRHRDVRWVAAYGDAVSGRFDAVSMFDVLYRIPRPEWPGLLRSIGQQMAPGAVFMLKELDPEHRFKQGWNRAQEWISDRFLKLTLGEQFVYATGAEIERELRAAGFVNVRKLYLGRGYPHAHVLYLAERP